MNSGLWKKSGGMIFLFLNEKKNYRFKNLCPEKLTLNGEIGWKKEYFTPIVSWENTLWTIWIPHSIDLLLPIRNYRLPNEPFPRNVEIYENWKFCRRLKVIKKRLSKV